MYSYHQHLNGVKVEDRRIQDHCDIVSRQIMSHRAFSSITSIHQRFVYHSARAQLPESKYPLSNGYRPTPENKEPPVNLVQQRLDLSLNFRFFRMARYLTTLWYFLAFTSGSAEALSPTAVNTLARFVEGSSQSFGTALKGKYLHHGEHQGSVVF